MKERQLMQKNLARLLRQVDYKSCGSDVGQQNGDGPVNPFMKRVFQKKMRRSSVASENVNPNVFYTEKSTQPNEYCQLEQLIQKGHQCLEKLKSCTKSRIQNAKNRNLQVKALSVVRDVVEKLKKSIESTDQQLQTYSNEKYNKLGNSNSIAHIQYYQCSSNDNLDRQSERKKNPPRQVRGKGLSGSMVSQPMNYKTAQPKSIYESVLEERKGKKSKRNKMI